MTPSHHIPLIGLTINLDDDLYAMARSHAIATKTSIRKAEGDLLRRRTAMNIPPASACGGSDSGYPEIDPVIWLPDGNVVVALADPEHEHHGRCVVWFMGIESFATCPITESTLLRTHLMHGGAGITQSRMAHSRNLPQSPEASFLAG